MTVPRTALTLALTPMVSSYEIQSDDDVAKFAIIKTIVYVGHKLQQGEALLLSTAHEIFMGYTKYAIENYATHITLPSKDSVTAKWILARLNESLGHHMSFTCKTRKYGTLLYRPDSDMVAIATQALWKLKALENKETAYVHVNESEKEVQKSDQFEAIINDLNDRVHQTVKIYLESDCNEPFDFSQMNIDSLIQKTDTKLWNTIMLLTRSTSEREGRSKVTDQASDASKLKTIRCFFILSAIMFCTDNRCSMPMHTLLADLIQCQGGSHLLIKIMNRIGVCSSFDALQRYMHYTISQPPGLNDTDDTLQIVSVDNLDFLHSYARVFKGNRQSSWHGTTIQKVRPLPLLEFVTGRDECAMETDATRSITQLQDSRKRLERPSPTLSPHKDVMSPIKKKDRRERTGVEKQILIESTDISTMASRYKTNTIRHDNLFTSQISLEDFTTNQEEEQTLADFQRDVNMYMTYRHVVYNQSQEECFIDIKSLFSLIRPTSTQISEVQYIEVLDTVADKQDTVTAILDNLYHDQILSRQMQYVIVEGDAKIYEIMQNIKYQYGMEFRWLVPYPGDWHLLKNYQVPLMKAYFDAGLKELANSCGYPLLSIQACSQFKRTHLFIMEVWESFYRFMLTIFISSQPTSVSSDFVKSIYDSITDSSSILEVLQHTIVTTTDSRSIFYEQFKLFLQLKSQKCQSWKFWVQFVFRDALAYVGLYLAIRSGDWSLRLASIKEMAAIFTAFDHQTYQKLISQHLNDIHSMPSDLISFFRQGAFCSQYTR